jgi:hypothetical protein
VDIKLTIREGSESNTFSVELEDKTRFVSATYLNVPITSMALIDYTGGERQEKPMERAHIAGPIPSHLEMSGMGLTGSTRPAKPRIGGRFEKADELATTSLSLELASTQMVDTLQLSEAVSLCLHALADLNDTTAIRSFLIQFIEKAGSAIISNTLLRPIARIR